MMISSNGNRPAIKIEFRLDENGNPLFIEQGNYKHYKIHISVENYPEDIYAVSYQLHPSYISPYRQQQNKDEDFGFNTTAYGDYVISAELLGKTKNAIASGLVSDALQKAYSDNNSLSVHEAIENIKAA
jgi:hypothetical protein